jgi:hypothetical protein
MTVVMSDYHGHQQELTDPVDAVKRFDEQAGSIMPHGGSGQSIWFGTAEEPDVLRVDVDVDAGRAALRWLPDGSHAVELDPDRPITVLESPDLGLVTIPAGLARVSIATARTAIMQYVSTQQLPTGVQWTK